MKTVQLKYHIRHCTQSLMIHKYPPHVDGCLNQIDEYLPRKTSQFGQLPTGAK